MSPPRPEWFTVAFDRLLAGQDLARDEATTAFNALLAGGVEDAHAAPFLTALRMKGETATEIAAAVTCLRRQMTRLTPTRPVLDTCGTGGDASGTFNISTAAAFVAAGAGVPVVKHGNRAVSSRSGSADVLRALGVPVESGPAWAQACLDRAGFAFCFAPHFHAGLAHVAAVRHKLGVRTIFNLLGPLANPAGAEFQLIGVGNPDLLDTLAGAVAELRTTRAILVCGFDGLDEVTLAAPTMVRMIEGGSVHHDEWDRDDFGLAAVSLADIQADTPAASAAIIREVLDGIDGPALRIVLANAAAALFTAGAVQNLRDGVERADAAVRSGAARRVLEQLQQPL